MSERYNISNAFYACAKNFPENTAIICGTEISTYGDIWQRASRLAGFLEGKLTQKRVGILGSRSTEAYVGILGAAAAGATYVPLNLKWPEERILILLEQLELDALIVDMHGAKLITDRVREAAPEILIAMDKTADISNSIKESELPEAGLEKPVQRDPKELGYIIFTSGSTGTPKGVMVSCQSLELYLDEADKWTNLSPDDRIAEAHDITFDLSVHNMFSAWRVGAAFHLMSQLDMMAPHSFVRKHDITVWMSVPTIVNNMRRANRLSDGLLPSLKLSIFCGEPLAIPTVEAWAKAAPNSVIENIYGPTECTIVCTRQTLTNPPLVTEKRGILAIGEPFENFDIAICGDDGCPLPDGETGEIALASDQLSNGYFKTPDVTEKVFRNIDGRRWYYTGDLGYRDENGILHHMGRKDNQVKMKGNRIELEEVESHLRAVCENEQATVVAWPYIDGVPQGLVGFVPSSKMSEAEVKTQLNQKIPQYMVPSRFVFLENMPRNINDKIDRRALLSLLEAETNPNVSEGRLTA